MFTRRDRMCEMIETKISKEEERVGVGAF